MQICFFLFLFLSVNEIAVVQHGPFTAFLFVFEHAGVYTGFSIVVRTKCKILLQVYMIITTSFSKQVYFSLLRLRFSINQHH